MKKAGIILLLMLSLLPAYKIHAQSSSAGFVSSNIWYSKDPFEEGDKIKIYTFVFNPDSRQLSGTVSFFDKTVFLGKKSFIVPAKGVKDISIDWTVTLGDHTIFGKIENAKFLVSAGKYEEVYLTENETEKSERTVSQKIIPKESGTSESASENTTNPPGPIQNIQNLIKEKTPDFIAEPISATANAVEVFRENLGVQTKTRKEEIKTEIKALAGNTTLSNAKTDGSKLFKPFTYVKLFFFTLASAISNSKLAFYGISIVVIILLLRFIWRLIFREE